MRWICLLAVALSLSAVPVDWESVKAEPNLQKRSELALVYAGEALAEAKTAWRKGDSKIFAAKLAEIREAVDLSLSSLKDTGRPPNKLVKWYKRAELRTRELSRTLDSFAEEVSLNDRPPIQTLNTRVQAVHDELLMAVISRKK